MAMNYTLGNTTRPRLHGRPLVPVQPATYPYPPIGPLCCEHEGEWTIAPDGAIEQLAVLPAGAATNDWLGFKATWDFGQMDLAEISVNITVPDINPNMIAGLTLALEDERHFMEMEIYQSEFGLYLTRWPEVTEFITCWQVPIPTPVAGTAYTMKATVRGQAITGLLTLGGVEVAPLQSYLGARTKGTRFGLYNARDAARPNCPRFSSLNVKV